MHTSTPSDARPRPPSLILFSLGLLHTRVAQAFRLLGVIALIAVGTFAGWCFGRWRALNKPQGPYTCSQADELRWIEHANVDEDFRQHVEQEHDMRFISVFGLSFPAEFPGLQDTPEMQRLVRERGFRHIEGTTDVISCSEQQQLIERVYHYAMQYNSRLLGYRECHK